MLTADPGRIRNRLCRLGLGRRAVNILWLKGGSRKRSENLTG